MFGVRSLLVDEKVLLMKKDLADVLFQRLIQRSQQSRLIRSDRRKCSNKINLDNMLKNKSLMLTFKQVSLLNAFIFLVLVTRNDVCLTLGKWYKRMGEILH